MKRPLIEIAGFDTVAYVRRLRLLREIVSGENQIEFAERLGVNFKRWSNYERGYPVPREVAFLLHEKFPGISIEWIWFGNPNNLSQLYRDKIREAEAHERELIAAKRAKVRAEKRLKEVEDKRKKAVFPKDGKASRKRAKASPKTEIRVSAR